VSALALDRADRRCAWRRDDATRHAPADQAAAKRTVNDGTPAPRSEATGATGATGVTERHFAAASYKGRSYTSHAPPAPSERVLAGSHGTTRRCLPAAAHSNSRTLTPLV